jgi:hypothetical protein
VIAVAGAGVLLLLGLIPSRCVLYLGPGLEHVSVFLGMMAPLGVPADVFVDISRSIGIAPVGSDWISDCARLTHQADRVP